MIFSYRPKTIHRLLYQPTNYLIRRLPITNNIKFNHFTTPPIHAAMKPGTPIPGLEGIYPKAKDPSQSKVPIVKPRHEYPTWVFEIGRPLPTLAKLKSMDIEDASDSDMKRYLKLTRRARIKANNNERAKS